MTASVKVLERHNKLIYKVVADHGGHVVKNQGDGFMMAFSDAAEAVLCSIEVQQALLAASDRWHAIRVRIGIHVGESVRRGDDLFGRNVAMAARVADQAGGGEILITDAVRDAIDGAADIQLSPPREVDLKGLTGSHEVFPVLIPA